ncbi:MAG TPA: Calx-beta domain-containing protein [Pyrinomonadaceae bacterium]
MRRRAPSQTDSLIPTPSRAEGVGEDVDGRQGWFRSKRAYPFGEIPAGARRRAWAARPKSALAATKSGRAQTQLVWTPIGPAPTLPPPTPLNWGGTSGRINAVAVSPANRQVILVGGSTGGIWRSADGGATFAPVSDDQVDLAVGWIAFAPSDPTVVYAGMGDMDYSYLGSGVLKSTNAGQTWTRVSNATLPEGIVARLEVDPANPDRVYLAQHITIDRATNAQAASGVFISTDGGINWTKKLSGQARDVVIHPADRQTIYACFALRSSTGGQPGSAVGLYRSTDSGHTWASIPVNMNGLNGSLWDFRVALSPSEPQRMYVLYGTIFQGERRMAVSRDAGATWQYRNLASVDMTQFGFNTYLAVDPTNADTVYLGSRDLWKSTDGGASFTNLTNNFVSNGRGGWTYQPSRSSIHPDQHAFAFEPGNSSVAYLANDGGLWKSSDGGAAVQSLNRTLSLVQFNSLATHPTDPAETIGGTQDNGTQRRLKDSTGAPGLGWIEISGADGGATFYNPLNPLVLYGSYYAGWLIRFKVTPSYILYEKQIGSSTIFGESDINRRIAFYPPFTGNGVNQRIYFGSWRLFISDNLGDTWTAPGDTTDLTKGERDVLSTIAVARSNTNVIYTGSAHGRAMISADGGASWRDITAGLPNRFIENIVVDPANPSLAYLSVSGYGTGHVFKTADAGDNWVDISGNLPNVPVSALFIDPLDTQTLYAGTDIGVFRSTSGGAGWESFNTGLPPVMVTAFAALPGGRIQVATYGRGAYELTAREVAPSFIAFTASSYEASEGGGRAVVGVMRTGDTSTAASVDFSTTDDPADVRCDDTVGNRSAAYARCDYATSIQTLYWAAGDSQPQTVVVPLIDDAHIEGAETLRLRLSNPRGATLGVADAATLVVKDNDTQPSANPVSQTPFFVRMQYLDFLSREPEAGEPWSNILNNCSDVNNNPLCDRITVSQSFFGSPEFRLKGFYVFNFYRVAFNRRPAYEEIIPDMRSVTGATGQEVYANRAAFARSFAARPEFAALYNALSDTAFVNTLLDRYALQQITTPDPQNPDGGAKVTLARAELVGRLSAAGAQALTRAQVLRAIVESDEVSGSEYNRAFVAMQYYGYLRRTPEEEGYQAWLKVINEDPQNVRLMVNGFMNSNEYRLRFGQ